MTDGMTAGVQRPGSWCTITDAASRMRVRLNPAQLAPPTQPRLIPAVSTAEVEEAL